MAIISVSLIIFCLMIVSFVSSLILVTPLTLFTVQSMFYQVFLGIDLLVVFKRSFVQKVAWIKRENRFRVKKFI